MVSMNWMEEGDNYVLDDHGTNHISVDGNGAVTFKGKLNLDTNGGAASASGLLLGVGTSASPATTSTASAKFVELRAETTATSGDNRLLYMRYAINGAGAGGESLRTFTKLTAAGSTVRGAHISLDIDGGSASGLGVGVDSQILLGDAALTGGNYAVHNFEVYAGGSSVDISGVTKFDILRFSLGGDATGIGNVEDNAGFINFAGFTAASGNIIDTDITALTGKAGLRVYVDGTLYGYIPVVTGS